MLRALNRSAEALAAAEASRYDPESAYGRSQVQSGPLGGKESGQQMKRRAALMALMERQKQQGHPSLTGASPAQQLMAKADVEQASDAYASGQASSDLQASNEKTRVRRNNGLGGMLGTGWTAGNSAEHAMSTQAQVMAGNKAMTGMMTPRGFSGGNDRPLDPRLSQQGRNQFGRIAEDAHAAQASQVQQTRQAIDVEAQRAAERRRLVAEGDAWAAQNQQQSQALHALGTRTARAY